jgi:hypothetical protein
MPAPSWDTLKPATAPPSWDALAPVSSPAPAGGAVPEDPRGGGLLSRMGDYAARGMHGFTAGIGRFEQSAANAVGLGDAFNKIGTVFGQPEAEQQIQGEEAKAAAPVPGGTDWQTLKANPSLGNIGSYVAEQGAAALPSLGAAAVALPAFAASRLGEVSHTRAQNEGRQEAGIMDLLKAAPLRRSTLC